MSPLPIISVENLRKSFHAGGVEAPVLGGLTFEQAEGEFLVLVGSSGVGKTTLLRLVAGLIRPDAGTIRHRGTEVQKPPPWVSMVFQDYNRSLFPWLSVWRNVAFGLHHLDRTEQRRRVDAALGAVGLGAVADRYPWQLSGGMQQRTALARAIAAEAALLLMDEPFGSVDAQTRIDLQEMVMSIWQRLGISALLVTHDIDEAVLMGDRVLVLSNSPATIVADIPVELPRPRDQLATKELPEFLRLRHRIYTLVRSSARGGAALKSAPRPMESRLISITSPERPS